MLTPDSGTTTSRENGMARIGIVGGHKSCLVAAKVMAGSALELFADPKKLDPIKAEIRDRTAANPYRCGIPASQKPPEKLED